MTDDGDPSGRLRALLVVNPAAHSTTPGRRARILEILNGSLALEEAETKARGHAAELAAEAVERGLDLVLALGGDGTVNEIANALAETEVALGVIPGGEANVLARAVGIPVNPLAAARFAIARARSPRPFPLGRLDDRYFTSNCGVGFDAAVVRDVEVSPRAKDRFGDLFFVWTGLRVFFGGGFDRRTPSLSLSWGDALEHRRDDLFMAIVQNVDPFTFLGNRPIRICPEASIDRGLDCLALDSLRTWVVLRALAAAFGRARHARYPHVLYVRDQRRLSLRSGAPLPVQVDGEYLGDRAEVQIELVPDALRLVY